MARIRTIKPEAFFSESLAEVSVEAERTFFGLLTQADDHGRHRDNAAIIAGLLWPLRAEHTSVHVEDDLQQLANAGLICRYNGCDGRRYLHIVTWSEHQKIDKPSQSRLSSCPQHHAADRCGSCKGTCTKRTEGPPAPLRVFTEASPNPLRALDRPAQPAPTAASPRPRVRPPSRMPSAVTLAPRANPTRKPQVRMHSPSLPRRLPETARRARRLDLGSWILDLQSLRGARRPAPPSQPPT